MLSFDLESKIRQGKYDPVRVWLALFGVPDGFAHVVDLRVTVPGEVTTEGPSRVVSTASGDWVIVSLHASAFTFLI